MMQQQSFQTPYHLPQQGRYPQSNQEIYYDSSNSRTSENLWTFEFTCNHMATKRYAEAVIWKLGALGSNWKITRKSLKTLVKCELLIPKQNV